MFSKLPRSIRASLPGAAALVWFGTVPAFAVDPIGVWQTEDGRARIRTEHCGSGKADLCGYVVWLRDPRDGEGHVRLDSLNADTGKRARPLLGHELMTTLKPNGEGRYEGEVYNADNGKLYTSEVWSETPSSLVVKGCVAVVICGKQSWTRVDDTLPGQLLRPRYAVGGSKPDR